MKRTFKVVLVISLFLFLSFSVFADESPKVFFPTLTTTPVYPNDSYLGQTAAANSSSEHELLTNALKTEYSFEWVESFVAEESKKMITSLYSTLLSQQLPTSNFIFSRSYKNADNSVSISVRITETNDILSFVLSGNKIINITSVKK